MLWLCLDLPHLPLAAYGPAEATARLVVCEGEVVLAAGAAARAAGVQAGMSLPLARRRFPVLLGRPRDEEAEATLLAELARWAGRFTSWVSLAPPRALLLEVGGSLSLFGGLARLERRLGREMRTLGHDWRAAVAPTPLAALWLAHAGGDVRVTDIARLRRALAPLPLAVLALPPRQRSALGAMGLATLGDLLRLPRDGLARRFGPGLLRDLDRALGRRPDPRPRFEPPPYFHRCQSLPAPATDQAALLFVLKRLLGEMAAMLRARAAGITELRLILHQEGATKAALGLATDLPTADPALWWSLARERLDRHVLAAPVERLGLRSGLFQILPGAGRDLLARRSTAGGEGLLARLRVRLGRRAVTAVALAADHRPERAWRLCPPPSLEGPAPAGRTHRQTGDPASSRAYRPLWLLAEPRRLAVRDGRPCWDGPLALEEGERIEGGWWDGADVRRDYFIARNPRGARLWIYRDLRVPGHWYLHGFFD